VYTDGSDEVCIILQKHHQARIHLALETLQRQIVVVVPERILELNRDEVHEEHRKHWYKREASCSDIALFEYLRHEDGCQQHVQKQQKSDDLRVRKWESRIGYLLAIEEVYEATRERLENSRKDWSWNH
jgi:hypothetical protein